MSPLECAADALSDALDRQVEAQRRYDEARMVAAAELTRLRAGLDMNAA